MFCRNGPLVLVAGVPASKIPVTAERGHLISVDHFTDRDFMLAQQGQVYELMLPFEPKEVDLTPNHVLLEDFVQDE